MRHSITIILPDTRRIPACTHRHQEHLAIRAGWKDKKKTPVFRWQNESHPPCPAPCPATHVLVRLNHVCTCWRTTTRTMIRIQQTTRTHLINSNKYNTERIDASRCTPVMLSYAQGINKKNRRICVADKFEPARHDGSSLAIVQCRLLDPLFIN